MEARADLTANRGPELNITTTVVLILAVFFVALRFWSRYVRGGHGLDDWMTLVALVWLPRFPEFGRT